MEDAGFTATVVLPLAVALIMFSLGLTLTPEDFKRILRAPRGVLIGLANLLVLSPLLAFAVASAYDLNPELAVGLVLLGAAPGGAMANMLTHLARGEVALSVTMTAISSVAAVVTVPLYLGLSVAFFDSGVSDDISMAGIVARVFGITIVPLALAMTWHARRPVQVVALRDRIRRAALIAFGAVVAAAIASEWETVTDNFASVALAALTLNVLAMTVGFTLSRAARLDGRQATAIAMELGVHNSSLAIAVGTSVSDELAIPAAVYSLFMFFTAGAFARVMYVRNAGTEPAAALEAAH